MSDFPEPPPSLPESFLRRRVLNPLLAELGKGITPDKVSATLALGTTLAIFPILGATTFLCGVAAWAFRLNQPIIQLVNVLVAPLQLVLMFVFYRAGESLFGLTHTELSIAILTEQFRAGPLDFLMNFGMLGLRGIVVWLLVAPIMSGSLYFMLRPTVALLSARVTR